MILSPGKAILASLLMVVVGSEIYVVVRNAELERKLQRVSERQFLQTRGAERHLSSLRQIEGSNFPLYQELALSEIVKETARAPKYLLLFYFALDGCDSCVRQEIVIWNRFSQRYSTETVQVIGVTEPVPGVSTVRLKKALRIEFPIAAADSLRVMLSKRGISSTPAVLFGETSLGRCIYAFLPTPGNSSEDYFVPKLSRFLASGREQLLSDVH